MNQSTRIGIDVFVAEQGFEPGSNVSPEMRQALHDVQKYTEAEKVSIAEAVQRLQDAMNHNRFKKSAVARVERLKAQGAINEQLASIIDGLVGNKPGPQTEASTVDVAMAKLMEVLEQVRATVGS